MKQASSRGDPCQLELFPGFDPRQRPLFPASPWATGIDVRYPHARFRERQRPRERQPVPNDLDVDRLETVNGGPMLDRIARAEAGE